MGYDAVIAAEPSLAYWWPLGDAGGTAVDQKDGNTGTYQNSVVHGIAGILGSSYKATNFGAAYVSTSIALSNPQPPYSIEFWFATTHANQGLMGFASQPTGNPSNWDRQAWIDTTGVVAWGIWTGFQTSISSPLSYIDGAWHHVVCTQASDFHLRLYVDASLVASNTNTGGPQAYTGYWRPGGTGGAWQTWTTVYNGTLAHPAVYSSALSIGQVIDHYRAGVASSAVFSVRDPQAYRIPGIN